MKTLVAALFTDSAPAMRINQEEIFGPVASVIRVKDYEEALAMANATPFGLSAGSACMIAVSAHPAIAALYGLEQADGRHVLVMELKAELR
jgi:Aldehyde dehydrogenase family